MIKYDYGAMARENFPYGGIFDRLGNVITTDYEPDHVEIGFYDHWTTDGKRAVHCWYYIRVDQDGISLHISRIIPKKRCIEICERIIPDAAAKMAELWKELDKYKFEPIGYEIRDGEQFWLKSEKESKTGSIVKMEG